MSLVIALAGRSEVVMASDSFCLQGRKNVHYTDGCNAAFSKIRLAANPHFAVGIAGHIGAEKFIPNPQAAKLEFEALVEDYYFRIQKEYLKKTKLYDMEFLFCGVEEKPVISRCTFQLDSNADPIVKRIEPILNKGAIGINEHGALAYMHSYHSIDMSTDQLIFLACFCMTEAISHDERLRRPIEIAVVRRGQNVMQVAPSKIAEIEAVCRNTHEEIGRILKQPHKELDCSASLLSLSRSPENV